MRVVKLSGEVVEFDEFSLRKSLYNSGADKEEADRVFDIIYPKIYDLIPTKELYALAFEELKAIRNSFAARYKLKRALQALGPEGFYFEKWVTKIFLAQGFEAIHSQTIMGASGVTHEIDIIAHNKEESLFCECKFRNDIDSKISVTTPMYFKSRFDDIKVKTYEYFGKTIKPTRGFVITNAYFTTDSIKFAEYHQLNLLSWNYPKEKNIKSLINEMGLYPITTMTTLTDEEEQLLLSKNCLLVKEIVQNPTLLDHFKFPESRKKVILQEANELLEYKKNVNS